MCDNMLYELAEEAKREISKYSDNYEIYLVILYLEKNQWVVEI